ncbi:MAG: DUF2125 domain-containing protein [Pseudomonadota bacterium]
MTATQPKKRGGFWLFFPFFLFLLLIGLYSAYWAYAKNLLDQGIEGWIEVERAAGHTVEYSNKSLGGYPFRFELTLDDPVYEDDEIISTRWEGQQLQLVMQPWNWQHVIARSPGMNRIRTGGEDISLLFGPKSAASLSWSGESVRRFSLAFDEVAASANGEPVADLDDFQFHIKPAPDDPAMLMLETRWQSLGVKQPLPPEVADLGPDFGPSILRLEADQAFALLTAGYDASELVGEILARGGAVRVPQLVLNWGGSELGAKAELNAASGEIGGNVGVRIDGADAVRAAFQNPDGSASNPDAVQAINALEAASANGGFLTMTIRGDGLYFLGNRIVPADIEGAL